MRNGYEDRFRRSFFAPGMGDGMRRRQAPFGKGRNGVRGSLKQGELSDERREYD